jgi:hypothetical protein
MRSVTRRLHDHNISSHDPWTECVATGIHYAKEPVYNSEMGEFLPPYNIIRAGHSNSKR